MRSGKVVQFNVTAIKHGDVLERLKRDWGISNRTANLVASQGSALAAIDGWCRWIESRLTDAEMRTGISLVLSLPQVDDPQLASAGPAAAAASAPACVCGAKGDANPATGDHAFLCKNDTMKQRAATASAAALAFVAQGLPGIKLYGRGRVHGSLRVRPDEPTFRHAAITIGAALVTPADADRRFDIGFTANGVQHYVDCLKTATISGSNIKQACRVQGHAAEAGDRTKITSYRKSISNLDAMRRHIWFATVDTNGTMSSDYTKLVQYIAKVAYPGFGDDGRFDVDGLRSRCVARLRVAVGCGVWRANHLTITAWAAAADSINNSLAA